MHRVASVLQDGGRAEDRLAVLSVDDGLVLVVADGAGGMANGARSAEDVVAAVVACGGAPVSCARLLEHVDSEIARGHSGQSTAAIAVVRGGFVSGASVGDSGTWLISSDGIEDLTALQRRKPLVGSGHAVPTDFGPVPLRGRLLLATDGLLKYVECAEIVRLALAGSVDHAARTLVDRARLPRGGFQDDVAVILCEDG